MSGVWLTTYAAFAAIAPAWDAAANAASPDNPFQQSAFLLAYCRAFVPPGALRIFVLRDADDAIVGGLPLFVKPRRRWPHSPTLHAVGVDFANLTEPFCLLSAPEFSTALGSALAALPAWRFLRLPWVRTPATAFLRLPGLARRERPAGQLASVRARAAAAHLAALPGRFQRNLCRRRRLASALGRLELRRADSVADVLRLTRLQLDLSRTMRLERGDRSGYSQTQWEAFTLEAVAAMAAIGRVDAFELLLGTQTAAVGIGFRSAHGLGGYNSILLGYNPALRHLGPGHMFHYELLTWLATRGAAWMQFYAGDEDYKRRWANHFEPVTDVRVAAPGALNRLALWGAA